MAGARKGTYKIANWRKYNESLAQRGSIAFWFSEGTVKKWRHDNVHHGVGHPYIHSDTAIECLLILRELLHLAVNPATHEIEAETLTENGCSDASQVDDLLDQATNKVSRFYGDGAYDNRKMYKTLSKRLIQPIIPPRRTAKIRRQESFVGCPLSRDRALREIRRRGRRR